MTAFRFNFDACFSSNNSANLAENKKLGADDR